jgi:hypothetical protein
MHILYLGKYKKRFEPIIQHIQMLPEGSRVLELCFGDVYLAAFCKKAGYHWTGLDINSNFVMAAKNMGFDAKEEDLVRAEVFPRANICIMMGSLYHFFPDAGIMLGKMFRAADKVVISEPVLNLSSRPGLIGFLAKRATSVGKRQESFRYNRVSLMKMLQTNSGLYGFDIAAVEDQGKDFIVKLIKK